MANIASAKKRIRRTKRQTSVNSRRLSAVRTFIYKVEAVILAGKKSEAESALRAAQPHMMRAAGKGITNRNTVSRKLSRLSKRIKNMAA